MPVQCLVQPVVPLVQSDVQPMQRFTANDVPLAVTTCGNGRSCDLLGTHLQRGARARGWGGGSSRKAVAGCEMTAAAVAAGCDLGRAEVAGLAVSVGQAVVLRVVVGLRAVGLALHQERQERAGDPPGLRRRHLAGGCQTVAGLGSSR